MIKTQKVSTNQNLETETYIAAIHRDQAKSDNIISSPDLAHGGTASARLPDLAVILCISVHFISSD